ncbi:MAG TPA: outer membrane beta-barrel protein [Puia sp.]|nr:outer membrane beta-barrel protein [Puia sp.]
MIKISSKIKLLAFTIPFLILLIMPAILFSQDFSKFFNDNPRFEKYAKDYKLIPSEIAASIDIATIKEFASDSGGSSPFENRTLLLYNLYFRWYQDLKKEIFGSTGQNNIETGIPGFSENKNAKAHELLLCETLEFARKGAKDAEGGGKTVLSYLQVAITLDYQYNLANGAIYAGIGPYFAYGIGGKFKGPGFSEPAFGGQDGFKRFDAGPRIMAGYLLPFGLSVNAVYDLGLVNFGNTADQETAKNRVFSVSVGYSITKLLAGTKK